MKINTNYATLQESYLFSDIAHKVNTYKNAHPKADIIRMGIGDVTLPLPQVAVQAMAKAVAEMGVTSTFKGYGEEQGYAFLRNAICSYYSKKWVSLTNDEVFVNDGAKSDLGNILDLFGVENTVLIPTPVYPVYVDTNVMAGRNIVYLEANAANSFLPLPKANIDADIIYICSPNNPTGAVYDFDGLKKWVEYALDQNAIILFDAAYEAFIGDSSLPSSIYQVPGAKKCAIELCSLSKTAGFTGTRCGYTIVPSALEFDSMSINKMWLRRQTTKFNGVSYIVQRGAEAIFTEEGLTEAKRNIEYYKQNAKIITDTMNNLDIEYCGGSNSPYIWLTCPNGMTSWQFFDYLLEKANIVGTPGLGFGKNADSFLRLSAFGSQENTIIACKRITELLG